MKKEEGKEQRENRRRKMRRKRIQWPSQDRESKEQDTNPEGSMQQQYGFHGYILVF